MATKTTPRLTDLKAQMLYNLRIFFPKISSLAMLGISPIFHLMIIFIYMLLHYIDSQDYEQPCVINVKIEVVYFPYMITSGKDSKN